MAKIQRKIERAEKGKYSGGDVRSCKKQMSLLERYWIPHLDKAPRVLVHGDLSANNIIVGKHSKLRRSLPVDI
jgi:aminoglycoside phosphotransferase (APT) family kinase protein